MIKGDFIGLAAEEGHCRRHDSSHYDCVVGGKFPVLVIFGHFGLFLQRIGQQSSKLEFFSCQDKERSRQEKPERFQYYFSSELVNFIEIFFAEDQIF